jgi:hypothetical protein
MNDIDIKKLNPREWLEYERNRKGYGKFHIEKEEFENILKAVPKNISPIIMELLKAYDGQEMGQIDDRQIHIFINPLIGILSKKEREIVRQIYFGIFPTFSFDGYAGTTPRGDKIVMLHSGLTYTVNYWAMAFLRSIEEGSDNFLFNDEDDTYNFFGWIAKLWQKDLDIPVRSPRFMPQNVDSWGFWSVLTHSTVSFILGHEIGHILNRHNSYSNDIKTNHKIEYEADEFGLFLSLKHSIINGSFTPDTFYTKFMLLGPYLALSIIATIQDCDSITHPSATSRLRLIEKKYESTLIRILGKKRFRLLLNELDEDILIRINSIGNRLFKRHIVYKEIIDEIVNSSQDIKKI